MPFSQKEKAKIIEALKNKTELLCPACKHKHSQVVDGYFVHIIQESTKNIKLSGQAIPTIVLMCLNCGFISQHALGILGFSADEGVKDDESSNP